MTRIVKFSLSCPVSAKEIRSVENSRPLEYVTRLEGSMDNTIGFPHLTESIIVFQHCMISQYKFSSQHGTGAWRCHPVFPYLQIYEYRLLLFMFNFLLINSRMVAIQ